MNKSGEQNPRSDGSVSRTPSDFDQRIYSPHTIAALVAELGMQGIPASVALEGTGLEQSQLENHKTQIAYRQLDIVIRNALNLAKEPTTAFRAGLRMRVTAYGMYGYALLSSATYAEVRDFANRYNRIIGPLCDISYSYEEGLAVCAFDPLHWPNPTEDVHRFTAEFALAAHLTIIRDLAGQSFNFARVALDYAAPQHADFYRKLFECPVLFMQRHNEYRYDLSYADGPMALADPRTHAMAREMCEQLLGEVNRAGGIAADIRRILIEQPGRYPSIEAIAEKIGMHPRALRRKLEIEETSYRDLLAEVRMRLAIEYLRKTEMTNEEIASRLGYSDASNFRHAFTRWTGKSPSEFRVAV
jgi:AraC-like DNA-binding protein